MASTSYSKPKVYGPKNRTCSEVWHCTSCFHISAEFTYWADHFRLSHMQKLVCEKCDLKFVLLSDAIRHQRDRHLQTEFWCSECNHPFYTKQQFKAHDCENKDKKCISTGFYTDAENGKSYVNYYYEKNEIVIRKTYIEDLPDYESLKKMMEVESVEYNEWLKYICSNED